MFCKYYKGSTFNTSECRDMMFENYRNDPVALYADNRTLLEQYCYIGADKGQNSLGWFIQTSGSNAITEEQCLSVKDSFGANVCAWLDKNVDGNPMYEAMNNRAPPYGADTNHYCEPLVSGSNLRRGYNKAYGEDIKNHYPGSYIGESEYSDMTSDMHHIKQAKALLNFSTVNRKPRGRPPMGKAWNATTGTWEPA